MNNTGPTIAGLMVICFLVCVLTTVDAWPCRPGYNDCGPGYVCINCGLGFQCALAPAECCGNTICGGGMRCMRCPSGIVCAVPPAECCGNGICGAGMRCMKCPAGLRCAIPPAVCCGDGVCGAGMICIQCPGGLFCAVPPAECCGSGVCGAGLRCIQTQYGPRCVQPQASPTPPPRNRPGQGNACDPQCNQYCQSIGRNGGRASSAQVCIMGVLSAAPAQVCTCW